MSFYSKGVTGATYFYSLLLLLIGCGLRFQEEPIGRLLFILALVIQLILLLTSAVKSLLLHKTSPLWLEGIMILMTVTLFSKYFYIEWWDSPSIAIVPIFIAFALYSLFTNKGRTLHIQLLPSISGYLLLTIPLFYSPFYISPRKYIPTEWYNRYDVEEAVIIELPHSFENPETEKLSVKAFDLQAKGKYDEATTIYKEALKMEPRNPILYFNLAECYSKANKLELAIPFLDSAILIDTNYAPFYNNRGLLYYKLEKYDLATNDFHKAISLDPQEEVYYANLSLVQFFSGLEERACKSLREAENLGLNMAGNETLTYIKKRCLQFF